ncbi:hypothetical protein [Aliarcobacter skirrowii]|uniref:hypothetical protein n=1 Tax=Aliarcobacter skirrowii TaxID=28200 RepID=UPI000D61EC2C|nr:hypothetical protein [Aliarcobacter skirrowii]PWE20082.1 hypothetical protein DGF29_06945 [Aliarcobacter skirrowii]PWE26325.1 hypothetical protein DGE88_00980 [Aliarcobacter skirrowii]RJO55529.1 hypothetical protein DIR39_06950 [Aliarcobacter skirrowii]RJO57484.1 hypothetical protein DIR38_06950 [Aliarcobacter skirrowii]
MRGYIDSIAFEIDNSILAKLELIGVLTVAKNNLILDSELLNEFIEYRATKTPSKQLLELRNLYKYLAILETQTGLKYRVMQHKRAKNITITFQGLKQFNEISELMRYDLKEFLEHFKAYIQIVRLDVAFDNKEAFNITQIAKNSKRDICKRWNTIYFKTAKEKKVNQYLNIKHYYKTQIKLYRLEFVFCKKYFISKEPFKLIEKTIKKILKKPFKFEEDFNLLS